MLITRAVKWKIVQTFEEILFQVVMSVSKEEKTTLFHGFVEYANIAKTTSISRLFNGKYSLRMLVFVFGFNPQEKSVQSNVCLRY